MQSPRSHSASRSVFCPARADGVHNQGVEGNKAFILPAVAALVLLALLWLRGQGAPDPAPSESSPAQPAAQAPTPGVKAQIREAVAAAGDPVLGPSERDAVSSALQPVVDRCRSVSPERASTPLKISVEVIAAQGLGLRVERAQIQGEVPAALVGCVREGLLGSKPADFGKTGRFSGTLEYTAP